MRTVLSMLTAAALCVTLAACGPDDDTPEPDLSGRLDRIHEKVPGP
jgi:hypothetical protein